MPLGPLKQALCPPQPPQEVPIRLSRTAAGISILQKLRWVILKAARAARTWWMFLSSHIYDTMTKNHRVALVLLRLMVETRQDAIFVC